MMMMPNQYENPDMMPDGKAVKIPFMRKKRMK